MVEFLREVVGFLSDAIVGISNDAVVGILSDAVVVGLKVARVGASHTAAPYDKL